MEGSAPGTSVLATAIEALGGCAATQGEAVAVDSASFGSNLSREVLTATVDAASAAVGALLRAPRGVPVHGVTARRCARGRRWRCRRNILAL